MNLVLVKSIAKLFAESYKPYCFGAFGKPTLRRVETALAAGRLAYACNGNNTTIAAAIFNVLNANSCHSDFSGRRCVLTRGSLYVRDLGVSPDYVAEVVPSLVNRLNALAQGAPFWIEIHEENKALREQLEKRLGFTYVMTKIMASSDIKGLYLRVPHVVRLPKLKACEIPSFVRLVPDFLSREELDAIQKELREYESRRLDPWTQHYSLYNKRHSWTALALRGYCPDDPDFIGKPTVMSKRWKAENPNLLMAPCRDTAAARSFRAAIRAVRRIPGQKERVRFMRLAARRGELSRHADGTHSDIGTLHASVIRLHIPLITHEDVFFESWDLRGKHRKMHFETGGLYYFDNRKPHRVINRSPVERIHLVVDAYASSELGALIGF